MLIKFANLREELNLNDAAAGIADQGRESIQVASRPARFRGGRRCGAVKQGEVRIANRLGLHARAAARFVHLANRFKLTCHRDQGRRECRRQVDPRAC